MGIYDGITPSFFGLPEKFTAFRPAQAEALEYAVYKTTRRFTALGLPTGAGKSLVAVAIAKALGVKAVYLTASRALQDQVAREFASSGMVDARGRSNYQCGQMYHERRSPSCEYGNQHDCSLAHSDRCPHDAAMARAEQSDLVVTNYANWLYKRKYNRNAFASEGRPVELLICDEAGEIPELVSDFVSIKIAHADEELPIGPPARGQTDLDSGIMPYAVWTTWAVERLSEALKQIARLRESYRSVADAMKDDRYGYLKELVVTCERIPTLDSNWVWEVDRQGVKFQPIWPGQESRVLWSGIGRVILMSATLRPYTLALCGVPKDDYDFREWPAVFRPQLGPVYHLPTVKLTWRSTDEDYKQVVERLDSILDARADRKGIVHTVSYSRARRVLDASRHRARFIYNETGGTANAANERFRNGQPDGVLVSPSFSTGFDFPGEACEFQVILKVPFPDTTSRVMTERCKVGDYRMYTAIQDLVQMCGRGLRYETDRCEQFILDDGVRWAAGGPRNPWHGHAPGWFKMQTISKIPPAPPRVGGR